MANFADDTQIEGIEREAIERGAVARYRAQLAPAWDKRSHALRVAMSRDGAPLLVASGWFVPADMPGLEHDYAVARDVPRAHELRSYAELADNYDEWFPFWRSADGRPVRWEEPHPPIWHAWMRLTDTLGCRGHLWSGAGRLLASGAATLFCRPNPRAGAAAAATPPADGASD